MAMGSAFHVLSFMRATVNAALKTWVYGRQTLPEQFDRIAVRAVIVFTMAEAKRKPTENGDAAYMMDGLSVRLAAMACLNGNRL